MMKVAITVWGKRISPVFDVARTLLIVEIPGRHQSHDGQLVRFPPDGTTETVVRFLLNAGIDTVICGAISRQPAERLEAGGIRLIPFIAGRVDQIVMGFASGSPITGYAMPGCGHCGRNRGRRRCTTAEMASDQDTPEQH